MAAAIGLLALPLAAQGGQLSYRVKSVMPFDTGSGLLPESFWWRWLRPADSIARPPVEQLPVPVLHSPFAAAFDERTHLAIVAGDLRIAADDLLFAGYQRRGAAAHIRRNDAQQFTLFSVRADPSQRYYGNTVTASLPSERSIGLRTQVRLRDNLHLTASYLGGETTFLTPDTVLLKDPNVYGGDSWNLALDSRLLDNAMRVYLEYAESDFDRDGLGRGAGAERGRATQAIVRLASGEFLPRGPFDYWTSDWRYRAVDGRYTSIANPLLPSDLETLGSWFRFGVGPLSGELAWRAEENNLARALRPTQRAERSALELVFSPVELTSDGWLWRRIGTPSLITEVGQTRRRKRVPDALTLVSREPVRQTDELRTTLNFSRPRFEWSLRWQQIDQYSVATPIASVGGARFSAPPDRHRELAGLKLGLMPSERIDLDLSVLWNTRWDDTLDTAYGEPRQRRHYGLDGRVALLPDRLSLQLHYRNGRDFETLSQVGLVDDHLQFNNAFLQLNWHALTASGRSPGLDLFVRGHYNEQLNERIDQRTEFWSAHLGLRLFWENAE